MLVVATDVTEVVLARQQVEAQERATAALNEELAAANEEILANNDELLRSRHELLYLNQELEARINERTKRRCRWRCPQGNGPWPCCRIPIATARRTGTRWVFPMSRTRFPTMCARG